MHSCRNYKLLSIGPKCPKKVVTYSRTYNPEQVKNSRPVKPIIKKLVPNDEGDGNKHELAVVKEPVAEDQATFLITFD